MDPNRLFLGFGQGSNTVLWSNNIAEQLLFSRKRLFVGILPANKKLFARTLLAFKKLFAGTLLANRKLFARTPNALFILPLSQAGFYHFRIVIQIPS